MKFSYHWTLVLFFLFFDLTVFGQLSQSAVPTWLRPTKSKSIVPDLEEISQGYYYDHIEYQVNLNTNTRFYKDIKVIFDNSGTESAGQINISFNPEYQQVILHELKVIRNGKELNKLDVKKFKVLSVEEELGRSLYNGMKSAYFIIDDLRKDDRVICSYSIQGFNTVFQNKFADSYSLQRYEPCGLIYVNYVVPSGRKLKFKSFNKSPQATVANIDNNTCYFWEITGPQKTTYLPNTPYWFVDYDYIECSEYSNWTEVSNWVKSINPIPKISPNSSLYQFVDKEWNDSKGNKYTFLEKVTNFVQNEIRYMGVEVGEYSHRANNPEKVFQQRYGDCKDKSVLLAAILQSKGIDGYLVLANSYDENGLINYLPSPLHFNHMIVGVSIDDRLQYIDPTISNQGGPIRDRYIPYYGYVLHTAYPESLSSIPKEVNKNINIKETYHLKEGYNAILEVKTVYEGGSADDMRSYFKSTAKNQIQKSYLDYYVRLYKKAEKNKPLRFEDDLQNNVFIVYEEYKIPEFGTVNEQLDRRVLGIYANQLSERLPEIELNHKGPISLTYPLQMEYEIQLINANGEKFSIAPLTTFEERDAYSYGKSVKVVNDTLKINYNLSIHSSFVEEKAVGEYENDFSNRDNLLYDEYYLDTNGVLEADIVGGTISWMNVLLILLTIIISMIVILKYNKSKAGTLIKPTNSGMINHEMDGWMVFMGLGIFGSIVRMLFACFGEDSIILNNLWIVADVVALDKVLYYFVVTFTIVANTGLLVFLFYSFYLYYNKRDIFPQTYFCLLIANVVVVIFDAVAVQFLFPQVGSADSETLRSILFSAIWAVYLLRSVNVREVFAKPYLARDNNEMINSESDVEKVDADI